MIKRIMAVLLTVAMVISMGVVSVTAAPATVKEVIVEYGTAKGINMETWLNRSIDVPVDIEVKETGTSKWTDGPLSITESNVGNIPTFDYKAVMSMQVVRDAFDDYTSTAEALINKSDGDKAALLADLDATKVTGTFTVKITIPADDFTVPEAVLTGSNMEGFNDAAKAIFHEVDRDVTGNVITITIGVGGTSTANAAYATKAELDEYLGDDLVFTCEGIQPENFGTYQVKGELEGSTVIGDEIATITYVSEPLGEVGNVNHNPDETEAPVVSATIAVKKRTSDNSGGGSSTVKVEFTDDGKVVKTVTGTNKVTVNPSDVVPTKEGYEFLGWYTDKELTKKASEPFVTDENAKLYAKWQIETSGPILTTDDHFAYIIGYVDGTVRPTNNIIREEVATIFFRLLTEEAGEAMHEEIAPYSDIPETRWSSTAIATLSKGGYITGRPDGTFAPEAYITRAEFATIAARFSGDVEATGVTLSDIDGHWAKSYIEVCAANGWITGYEDGTFKPDQYITRAEAMAIVNRMLGRAVDEDGIAAVKDDIYMFSDNTDETAWHYYIVLEATNSHDFERADGEAYETWTKVTEVRDWAVYER